MGAGALVLLGSNQISIVAAFRAIDWDLILYLFAVFSIASALYDTGISQRMGQMLLQGSSQFIVLLLYILVMALCSAILTNDAAAVIGVPIALMLTRYFDWPIAPVLVALCATVTAGSMVSPVGNPQNILIANAGNFPNMFSVFAFWIFVPAAISLIFVFWWFAYLLQKKSGSNNEKQIEGQQEFLVGRKWPALLSAGLLVLLIGLSSILHELEGAYKPSIGEIGLVACLPIYIAGNQRLRVFREVDWATLMFFVAMFVVTGTLLVSGSLEYLLGSLQQRLAEPQVVASVSFFASQLFSNVPVVELYLNLLQERDTATLMMLSAISTACGNLFIISAASNVIVVQQAEKFGVKPFTFWQFTIWMLPVTLVSVFASYLWIIWFQGA